MWPFKKVKTLTMEEAAALEPMPPCGYPVMHLTWKLNGTSCPACAAKLEAKRNDNAENRLAEKIADLILQKISQPDTTESGK